MDRTSFSPEPLDSTYVIKSIQRATGLDYKMLDLLKYEIDKHIYYFGRHFNFPYEKARGDEETSARLLVRL